MIALMFILRACMGVVIILWMLGMFIPAVDCWNNAGTQMINTEDSIVLYVRHHNCTCDTSVYINKKKVSGN